MKIGHYTTAVGYTETRVEDLVGPLQGMTISSGGLTRMLENDTDAELMAKVDDYWALSITQDDVDEIRNLQASGLSLNYALARVVSKNYTVIGWTTHGHNGETVPVWIHGAEAPVGTIDNTDLALMAANAMRVDLGKMTDILYVDLDVTQLAYNIDLSDPDNPVLIVNGAKLPVSKDYMVVEWKGKSHTVKLPGLTVYAPETGKVYVSMKAVKMLKRF
jgi:alkaline phosphatase